MIWRVYAWALLLLLVVTWFGLIGADIRAIDLIDIPVSIVGLIGVFGFAYRTPVFRALVWRTWFVLQPVWDIAYNLVGGDGDVKRAAIVIAIAAPGYVALFLYAYRSRALWRGLELNPNEEKS